ncbi:MAG: sensor histidine kinase [Oscillospiraceae bacterium]|nr:sensor histidine kinase [Oscillospiraceae bacterium]
MILNTGEINLIVSLLAAVTVSSVSQYTENKYVFYLLQGTYAVLCFFVPAFFLFLPVNIYEVTYRNNRYVKFLFCILPLICFIFNTVLLSISVVSVSIVSTLLSVRTEKNEQLSRRLIKLRDSTEENQQLLLERNKYLMLGRDNEINLAVMSERNRIAREIHDNVGHMLSRTLLQMGALRIINKDRNLDSHLEEINNSLNSAMTSMRESVHNLHDDSVSLGKTVKELIKPLENDFSIKLDMDISEKAPKEIKFCFIGIIKEAVSNIIRYSNGDSVVIVIREHPGFYQASVEDNGKNSGNINQSGIGLENMKIRAEKLGGIFKFYAEKNKFRVFVSIPKVKEQ